jgi:hypothetical protein
VCSYAGNHTQKRVVNSGTPIVWSGRPRPRFTEQMNVGTNPVLYKTKRPRPQ